MALFLFPDFKTYSLQLQLNQRPALGNTLSSRGFWGRIPKGHNREPWRIIFSYKHVWMAWVGVIYYGKRSYYELINCIRHCFREEFIQKFFKIFNFSLIRSWDSLAGWPVAKPLCIRPCNQTTTIRNFASKSTSLKCIYWNYSKS